MTRRPWAWPLWPFYAAASGLKDALYTKAILKPKRLTHPVLSIGSISAGGAGKTPAVIALTRLLQSVGYHPDILSRGYGRTTKGVQQVDPTAPNTATLYGDEPVLIAIATGVPVWVASQRHAAGLAAEAPPELCHPERSAERAVEGPAEPSASHQTPNPFHRARQLHLLDDGFQHRQLSRHIDIALITLEDLNDELLPVGNLREAPYALHRADILVIREEERKKITPRLRNMDVAKKPIWTINRTPRVPAPQTVLSAGLKPLAFCALARPENFEAMLREAGCDVTDTLAFRDHHAYTPQDMQHIIDTAKKLNATGFVTTEKDAVKLTVAMRATLEAFGPLVIVALEAAFEEPAAVLRDIEARLT